jgi:uncharacterized membrane protein
MFLTLHSFFNSHNTSLLHLTDQHNSQKSRLKAKDGIILGTIFLGTISVDWYTYASKSFYITIPLALDWLKLFVKIKNKESMFLTLHSFFSSYMSGLLHLTGRPNSEKSRLKFKDIIISGTLCLGTISVDWYNYALKSFIEPPPPLHPWLIANKCQH